MTPTTEGPTVRDEGCGYCHRCRDADDAKLPEREAQMRSLTRGMVVCETCGCKRCPHASDHRNACTGSNDVGQPGSVYGSNPSPPLRKDPV